MKVLRVIFIVMLGLVGGPDAWAQLGNAWHLPNNTVPGGDTMRTPAANVASASTVTIYSGNQFQGGGNSGNQTGGALFYKTSLDAGYQSAALSFHATSGNDKFWKGSISLSALANASGSGLIQYYLRIDYSDHAATYLYGDDASSHTTGTQATAAGSPYTFGLIPELTVNGVGANYTTSKLYVDEVAGSSATLSVVFKPNGVNVDPATVQVYTNLNRRDRATADADGDGFEDGVQPPDAGTVTTTSNTYYGAYAMNADGGGQYSVTLSASRTGAYRLTARWRQLSSGTWNYFSTDGSPGRGTFQGRRDHAITVAPTKARSIEMYQVNPLTIEAQGTTQSQRSTFADLLSSGQGDSDGFDPFNLGYLQGLNVNWIWFQPIHPAGIDGRQIDPDTGLPFEVGSPYAVKNFFKVNPLLGADGTETGARAEFQTFVNQADLAGVNVMLDAPFNHTSYDVEVSDQGTTYFGGAAGAEMRATELRFFSRGDQDAGGPGVADYAQRANLSNPIIALAPDRGDFGKFSDTYDVYYGRYSALVNQYPADANNFKNEDDKFLYDDANWTGDAITRNVWRYFGDYVVYWLTQTGCIAGLTPTQQVDKGIDGLRADFGQGLPPQAWEYIINKARSRKWSFVFMAESLDGGEVTYRSNRHFDVLNENIVFPLHAALTTTDFRNIYEARRAAYGQAMVLLNSSSHDEDHYKDPFQALMRYAVNSTIDGAPLIFPGQELGLSGTVIPPADTNSGDTGYFGYDRYEINFGKPIPHFKKFNSLMPLWNKMVSTNPADFGLQQLRPVFSAIGQARLASPALRSSNRFFLDQTGGTGAQAKLFSVAKFETKNASPANGDVVFGFVNLDRAVNSATPVNNGVSGTFNIAQDTDGNGVNDYGIKAGRTYNIKNLAAYVAQDASRNKTFIWADDDGNASNGVGKSGSNLLTNGLSVALNKVPESVGAWTTAPWEPQYLKLYDVTPPPASGAPGTPKAYALGTSTTFSWAAASDPDGGVAGYHVTISTQPNGGGTVIFDGQVAGTSKTVTAAFGQTLYASVRTVNNAGISSNSASASSGGTILLDPAGDQDSDGQRNDSEDLAGTNPLDHASVFVVTLAERLSATQVRLTWSSVPGKNYEVQATADLAVAFGTISGATPIAAAGSSTQYTDNSAGGAAKFYKVRVVP